MATWNEQINDIQKLRQKRSEADDNLYVAQINLLRAENTLKKIKKQETNLPADTGEIAMLRKKIAELENRLQELNKKISEISNLSGKIREYTEKIHFIEKKIQLLSSEINDLNIQLTKEQNNRRPDQDKVKELQNRLEKTNQLLKELEADLTKLKTELALLHRGQQEAEAGKQELEQQRDGLDRDINALQEELNDKLNPAHSSVDEAEQKKKELEERKKKARIDLDLATNNLNLAIEAIYVDPHPRSVVNKLDDSIPFLFLPVRIETRFMTTGRTPELWLRIYPDDISIHTHEKVLADKEITEGERYWKFIFNAEKDNTEEKEELKKSAWSNLVLLFGSQRSAWIAKETRPVNWNDVANIESADQLVFPVHRQSKPFEWSRAPRTNVLPDKFVVMLYQGNNIVKEVSGNIIPDELFIGPDPLEAEESFKQTAEDKTLSFGNTFDWTSEFEKALQVGMGFKIQLTPEEAVRGFDKILVLGVYSSAHEAESKQAIEDLIDNHHYSPKGFGIITQGTPTNNTEQDGSGFTKNDPFDSISFFVETGDALFDKDSDCDGKNLAHALGIEYDPLQYVSNSDAKDLKAAVAMNTALYPSTLGYYFSTMMKPVLNDTNQDTLRNFFIKHVSGRGPLPAIRVGNQPYGVLLTSDFSKWQWKQNETEFGNPFLSALYKALDHYHNIWKSVLDELMYTGKPGADPSEVLMNILGLQSGSVSFFQRNGFSTEELFNRAEFEYGGKYYNDLISSFTSKATLLNFLRGFGFEPPTVDGKINIPQLLRLVYQHYHTKLDPANVVENFPLSENDPLHNYTGDKNYIHWLLETNSVLQLERQDFGPDIKPPTSLLYMQLRRSLLLAIAQASVNWFKGNNISVDHVMDPVSFHNIRPGRDLTKWEVMKAKLAIALPEHPQKDKAIAEHLLTTGKNENEAAFLNKIKESLELLAGAATASLERCFTEHVDTCTYRLDAWQTALFHQRLKKQRQLGDTIEQPNRKKGIYLGAYGWVEDIRPGAKRQITQSAVPTALQPPNNKPVYEYADNGGFVHAPSINQATAAAVLRSGYLNHASSSNPDVMAVNLSSERVRRALFVLEGLRNEQSLEALLGFQFERGLHDRGSANDDLKRLNKYIYDFRDQFPINQHLVQQEGVPNATTETIETNNVVNGLTLAETTKPYPYDVNLDLAGLSATQIAGIEAAIKEEKDRLEDTLDAIKDLLLSESVYQMVQGNFDRTAAVTTALKDAKIPPSIEVTDTIPSNHLSFTNRVTIQFDPGQSFTDGSSPRAKMEAGINKWLREIIGEPEDLICLVSHKIANAEEQQEVSMDDLNLQPVDLIYIAGNDFEAGKNNAGASELESRLAFFYRNEKELDDDIPVKIQFVGSVNTGNKKFIGTILPVLKTLKVILTDSRPLHARDFDPPSKPSMADKTNPHGYILHDLKGRIVDNSKKDYQEYHDLITAITITRTEAGANTEVLLGNLFGEMDAESKNFTDIEFSFSTANALTLRDLLIRIAGYGLPDSFPQVRDVLSDARKLILLEQARNIVRKMDAVIQKTDDLLVEMNKPENSETERKIAILVEIGKELFGNVFNILPRFTYNNPADIQQSNADRDQLLSYAKDQVKMKFPAEEWMQKTSAVRPRLARWDYVRTIYELYNDDQLNLAPVQLPYRATDSWLAVEFPEKNSDDTPFNIANDTLSIVIHGEPAFLPANNQCGLLIDDWTEVIPAKEAITGLTFNYNQPDAMPPQALLLVVTPEEKGKWSWDDLTGILNDTMLRAKLRAVEPRLLDQIKKPDTGVLLPAIISTFSQHGLDISLDYRNNVAFYENNLPLTSIG
jgi:hypothetical protein